MGGLQTISILGDVFNMYFSNTPQNYYIAGQVEVMSQVLILGVFL